MAEAQQGDILLTDAPMRVVLDKLKLILTEITSALEIVLHEVLESEFTSFQSLAMVLRIASNSVKSWDTTSMLVAAWLDNFVTYVLRAHTISSVTLIHRKSDENRVESCVIKKLAGESIDNFKPVLIRRAKEFALMTTWARGAIAMLGDIIIRKHALKFIDRDVIILVHGFSRMVLEVLKKAAHKRSFKVFCTDGRPYRTGIRCSIELQKHGISSRILSDTAVACRMDEVDMVLVGANGVDASGGVISQIGTFQISVLAMHAKIPVYVAAESFKFGAPIPEKDVGNDTPAYDYTPPEYLEEIISDSGVLLPGEIREELTRLYTGHFPF